MIPLHPSNLETIAESVPVPGYDRSALTTGIVHLGVGNFHRAHEAAYLDDLLSVGGAPSWGICGIGVLPHDAHMRDVLERQDGLFTLALRHPDGRLEPRVVGSLVRYLFAPDDPEAVLDRLAEPAVRIVSLTITEGGYPVHFATGEFDAFDDLAVDAAASTPSTVFGFLVQALARRRDAGIAPFTVMSCDNIQENGRVARAAVVGFARLRDASLADWIAAQVAFPSSMVDRITPITTDADRALIRERFGIDDGWPVLSEPFRQWVLEDDFPEGRPALERVGVQLVDDVVPYELMKLRLLNLGHKALAYVGSILGYRYAHETMADADIRAFVRAYMDEATPTLEPVPGVDLDEYKDQLIERFANREVRDTLARLCAGGTTCIPKWLLPVVEANLAAGHDVVHAAAILASWARYAEGVDDGGRSVVVDDPLAEELVARAARHADDDLAFLRAPDLFGDLVDEPRFTEPYRAMLRSLRDHGARATLQRMSEHRS